MAAHPSSYEPKSGIARWLDARLPIARVMYDQFMVFPTPRNLNYWWTFGGILAVMLAVQLVTGIVAIRQALDFDTGKAVATAVIAWIVVMIVTFVIFTVIFGTALAVGAAAGGG